MIHPSLLFPGACSKPSLSIGHSVKHFCNISALAPSSRSFLMALTLSFTSSLGGSHASVAPPAAVQSQPTPIYVQEVKSSKGITAWMVKAPKIPVISVAVAFKNAGTSASPKGLAGLVNLLSGLLDEGAGDWDSQGFKKFLLEKNIQLSISTTQDNFQVTFRTVKENIDAAFEVLNTILTKPRFADEAVRRVKKQIQSMLEQSLYNEHSLAADKLHALVYGDHPYGITTPQTLKEFQKVTPSDMRTFMKERFAQDQLFISVVGDINAEDVKNALDKTFGDLPAKAVPVTIGQASLQNRGATAVVPLDIPQSVICFVQPGIPRNHPDFYAIFAMMKIMGDGQFESRLWKGVREERGLAYGIDASLSWSQHASLVAGGTATKNANVKEVIDIIKSVWNKMGQGATQDELDFVKRRMIGGFALNFTSTLKIANALLSYQLDNLGIDFINKRNKIISELTLEQINSVAKSFLKPEQLTFVVVGQPEGITSPLLPPQQETQGSK